MSVSARNLLNAPAWSVHGGDITSPLRISPAAAETMSAGATTPAHEVVR